jgi:hypothetical protein
MTLREIWISQVEPDDYETHMAAIGQAQANARLVCDLFEAAGVAKGSRVLIAGAGTGQMFDYLPHGFFDGYRLILNPAVQPRRSPVQRLPPTLSNCCADHLLGDKRFFCKQWRLQADSRFWWSPLPD